MEVAWLTNTARRRFIYEGHPQFSILPTLACTFPFWGASSPIDELARGAGVQFDPAALVHGEQELTLHVPLQPATILGRTLQNETRVASVVDRGSGALVTLQTTTTADGLAKVATNTMAVFIRGLGGFAGRSRADGKRIRNEVVPPHAVLEDRTEAGAAALYRLTGDLNPLHIDPAFARRGGFPAPILHGLCTLGHAVRCILAHASSGGSGSPVHVSATSVTCRFTGPVVPGQALVIRVWYDGPHAARFQVTAGGRPAIDGGIIQLSRGSDGHAARL
jgi:acyl dehydratase